MKAITLTLAILLTVSTAYAQKVFDNPEYASALDSKKVREKAKVDLEVVLAEPLTNILSVASIDDATNHKDWARLNKILKVLAGLENSAIADEKAKKAKKD